MKFIFVFGMPRSGTSWLAKILDSHPEVVYRHEPDIEYRHPSIPYYADDMEPYLNEARDYIVDLARLNSVKSRGSLPIFPKRYLGPVGQLTLRTCVHVARIFERGGVRLGIPDLFDLADQRIVIKSVSAMGRAGLFTKACNGKAIIILRHPCGQIASQLRGVRNGKLPPEPLKWPLIAPVSKKYGLDKAGWEKLDLLENLSWKWVIANEIAMMQCPSAFIVRHEDLCDRPIDLAREIFDFAELDWSPQTEAFLDSSSSSGDKYFSVFRDSRAEANKWRGELAKEEIEKIISIAADTPSGRLYEMDPP